MTEYLINMVENYGQRCKGLIIVNSFDGYAQSYLSSYETLRKGSGNWLVRNPWTDEEFYVFSASTAENCRGRRANHIIIDKRIDDMIVRQCIFPYLVGYTRKVELF